MKKAFITLTTIGIISLFVASWGLLETWAQGYTLQAVCLGCDSNLTCQFEDIDGNIWTAEDCYFLVGEPVTLYMHDNYTPNNLYDDIVVDVVSNRED